MKFVCHFRYFSFGTAHFIFVCTNLTQYYAEIETIPSKVVLADVKHYF